MINDPIFGKYRPGDVELSAYDVTLGLSAASQQITVARRGSGAITARSSNESICTVTVSGNVVTIHSVNTTTGQAAVLINVAGSYDCLPASAAVSVKAVFVKAEYSVQQLGSGYGFALNSAGYYESQNKGVQDSYALCKINLTVHQACTVRLACISNGESNYDFGILSNLDKTLASNNNADSSNVKKSFKGSASSSVVNVDYSVSVGSHYITAKYIKDSSENKGYDSLQFKVSIL